MLRAQAGTDLLGNSSSELMDDNSLRHHYGLQYGPWQNSYLYLQLEKEERKVLTSPRDPHATDKVHGRQLVLGVFGRL